MVKPRRSGVFLARPLSVAGWEGDTANGGGKLRFLAAQRGAGSGEIVELRPGDEAELIGPLGNCWLQAGLFANAGMTSTVALVGGGIGIAPLLLFAKELAEMRPSVPFDFYAGFRSRSFAMESVKTEGPRSLIVSSEDGSEGVKGRITEFFSAPDYGGVFVCGPEPLIKAVSDSCAAAAVPCYASLERHMACGVGACLGCTVMTSGGNRRCCADGPIFSAGEVCFDG